MAPQPANTSANAASPSAAARRLRSGRGSSTCPFELTAVGSVTVEVAIRGQLRADQRVAALRGEALARPAVGECHYEGAHRRFVVVGQDGVGAGADLVIGADAVEFLDQVWQQPLQAQPMRRPVGADRSE